MGYANEFCCPKTYFPAFKPSFLLTSIMVNFRDDGPRVTQRVSNYSFRYVLANRALKGNMM